MTYPPPARPPRIFTAGDIIHGAVSLDGYPLRYIAIGPDPGASLTSLLHARKRANMLLDMTLTAVEILENRGWNLVALDQGGMVAVMRHPAAFQR